MSMDPEQQGQENASDVALSRNLLALSEAINLCASKASGSGSAAEAKDFMQAALYGAQAVVIMDPARDQGGVPLEPERQMERVRKQAQSSSAAPSPGRSKQ